MTASALSRRSAIRGDRIVATGGDADVKALIGPQTRVVDLKGRTVVPGLHDSHMHTMNGGVNELAVRLPARARSAMCNAFVPARVPRPPRAASDPCAAAAGTRTNLPKAACQCGKNSMRSHRIIRSIWKRGGHVAVANSVALKLANITRDTSNPRNGIIVRDPASGEPTGVLVERPAFNLVLNLPPPPRGQGQRAETLQQQPSLRHHRDLEPGLQPRRDRRLHELYKGG